MAALPPAPPDITRRIQDEYQAFFRRYRDNATGLRRDSLTPRTPFYISVDPTNANFVCTRDSFYLSLLHFFRVDRQGSIDRFHRCAQQGIPLAPGAAAVDPVDAAIHAYSIVISNLINEERRPEARDVIEFLQLNYNDAMSDPRSQRIFRRNKDEILLLIGENVDALRASPMEIRTDVLDLVHYLFRNEQRYIASSPLAKKVICNFVLRYRQANMIQVYETLTPLARAHFFVSILENNVTISHHTPQIRQGLELELMTPHSPLNELLQLHPNSNASQVAEQIRDDIRHDMAQQRKQALTRQSYQGSGGSKKGKFNKVKSKSRKTYKNKINNKKTHRRHRHPHR